MEEMTIEEFIESLELPIKGKMINNQYIIDVRTVMNFQVYSMLFL